MNQAIVWMATIDRIFFQFFECFIHSAPLTRSDPFSNWHNMINMIPKQKETTVRRTKTETNHAKKRGVKHAWKRSGFQTVVILLLKITMLAEWFFRLHGWLTLQVVSSTGSLGIIPLPRHCFRSRCTLWQHCFPIWFVPWSFSAACGNRTLIIARALAVTFVKSATSGRLLFWSLSCFPTWPRFLQIA